ncbi:unnamed protein product, partial [Ectocarpus sp. 8 AP-2014]
LISVYAKRALNKVLEEDRVEQEALEMGLEGGNGGMNNMEQSAQDGARPAVVEHAVRMPV